ncbi:MAG: hypothetical protein JWN78_2840 [Bacteroidota bacterium]|nr:hypothetical protein [Bacteroidota bacterium]
MKNIIYLLAFLICFSCKKSSTTTNNNNNNNTEPTVTGKYYVKYKLDGKWYLSQENEDQHADQETGAVTWTDGSFVISLGSFYMPSGLATKSSILALQGQTFTFDYTTGSNIASIGSQTLAFDSYYVGATNTGTLHVNTVTDLNKVDSYSNESMLEMTGTFTNAKVEMDAGGTKTVTDGSFKILVGTEIY